MKCFIINENNSRLTTTVLEENSNGRWSQTWRRFWNILSSPYPTNLDCVCCIASNGDWYFSKPFVRLISLFGSHCAVVESAASALISYKYNTIKLVGLSYYLAICETYYEIFIIRWTIPRWDRCLGPTQWSIHLIRIGVRFDRREECWQFVVTFLVAFDLLWILLG